MGREIQAVRRRVWDMNKPFDVGGIVWWAARANAAEYPAVKRMDLIGLVACFGSPAKAAAYSTVKRMPDSC